MIRQALVLAAASISLSACQSGDGEPGSGPTDAFDAIGAEETIHFTGTEPFWGGEISGTEARYSTPENPDGTAFAVQRFAGNNGLGFTGAIMGAPFDLTITPGDCSDGMSDRTYPYTATLLLGGNQRNGCAYTDVQGIAGPENP
ncbi:COG3650 family protein [Qipengyuania gelatinilytica]|uniref:Lipoprotein n=1 Tax=Qipengyuania gelatinilytica TaxID=2867231 RepID=A0ABX9A3N2_9SPHN|nr:hypothetical protein [Qipengyuania gelatinilytica]QZD94513.1 hypothetical protein K3136_10460 [Qipengyuania gelatinilytica]